MKFGLISVVSALSTATVTGFIPSSFSRTAATGSKSSYCRLEAKRATEDVDLSVFVDDMLRASSFVYTFQGIRDVVRESDPNVPDFRGCDDHDHSNESFLSKVGSIFKKKPKQVEFFRPELIITDNGAQELTGNRFLKYPITADAIKLFIENNRRYLTVKDGDVVLDDEEKNELPFEAGLNDQVKENLQVLDYDDQFTTDKGGLVYSLVVNISQKWVGIVFRGTVGLSDIMTDRDFRLNDDFFFQEKYGAPSLGGKPATHAGFTRYLANKRKCDVVDRPLIDRIISSVDDVFKEMGNKRTGYRLFVTGHSLGGGLANLCAFHAANLKEKGDPSVKHFPNMVKAVTFAAPVVGNDDFNKEYQRLESEGILRHIRIANQGDVVPTNNIPFPLSLALRGNSKEYTQNGVNLFLRPRRNMDIDYRNTKSCLPELLYGNMNVLNNHMLTEYNNRLESRANKELLDQTVEELYDKAGDFTN